MFYLDNDMQEMLLCPYRHIMTLWYAFEQQGLVSGFLYFTVEWLRNSCHVVQVFRINSSGGFMGYSMYTH